MSARGRDFPYLKKIASGNAPSTGEFFMHSDYAALDGLIPLENMENYNEITNELHPKLRDLKTADSSGSLHIHAIPTHYTPRLLLTNTSILTEAGLDTEKGPKTLEELNKWIQTLSKRGKKSHKKYRSFHMDYPTHCDATIAYFPYLWNISGYTKANNKEEFAETLTKNSDWLEYFCKLYKSNSSFRAERGPENFILGKTAIALSDGSNILRLTDCLYPDFEIKAFPIPPLKKGSPSISSIGDLSVGIFRAGIKNEAELEASWRWIKFLLRPDTQKKLTDRHWTLPASTKTQIPPLMNKNKEAFTNAIKNAKPQYDFKGARQTLTILAREMLKAIESQKTAKQATIDAKNKILESII
jgi:ABC-type glycerol-3-phosphate transport system substrate-binding protein